MASWPRIKHNLENLGFTVSATVPSGEETLDKVKEENPDLVLKGSSRNRFPLHLLPRN